MFRVPIEGEEGRRQMQEVARRTSVMVPECVPPEHRVRVFYMDDFLTHPHYLYIRGGYNSPDERLEVEEHRDDSLEGEEHRDDSLEGEEHRDDSLEGEEHRDEGLEVEEHSDDSLEVEEHPDDSLEGEGHIADSWGIYRLEPSYWIKYSFIALRTGPKLCFPEPPLIHELDDEASVVYHCHSVLIAPMIKVLKCLFGDIFFRMERFLAPSQEHQIEGFRELNSYGQFVYAHNGDRSGSIIGYKRPGTLNANEFFGFPASDDLFVPTGSARDILLQVEHHAMALQVSTAAILDGINGVIVHYMRNEPNGPIDYARPFVTWLDEGEGAKITLAVLGSVVYGFEDIGVVHIYSPRYQEEIRQLPAEMTAAIEESDEEQCRLCRVIRRRQ